MALALPIRLSFGMPHLLQICPADKSKGGGVEIHSIPTPMGTLVLLYRKNPLMELDLTWQHNQTLLAR